jgi:hypothetical protein
MRIALVGWHLDVGVIRELAQLGTEIDAFTTGAPDQGAREETDGWNLVLCHTPLGAAAQAEAASFAVQIVESAGRAPASFGYDVVHALDGKALRAGAEIAARCGSAGFFGALRAVELAGTAEWPDDLSRLPRRPDAWICDHPWAAQHAAGIRPDLAPVFVVLERAPEVPRQRAETNPGGAQAPPVLLVPSAGCGSLALCTLTRAVRRARQTLPRLSIRVLGSGGRHERICRRLRQSGLLADGPGDTADLSFAEWNEALAQATLVGLAAAQRANEPVAQLAWLAGKPVVHIGSRQPARLARAIADAVISPAHRDRQVRAAAALAARLCSPGGIAQSFLKRYLCVCHRPEAASARPGGTAAGRAERARLHFPELQSRLTLTPISPREAVASWTLRGNDWNDALEWLGADAVRAVLAIRLFDVTDIAFSGQNAHATWDVDLSFSESFRTISLHHAGRSLAGSLGVRTQWGYFHPIAHSRICHLPREETASAPARRTLRVLSKER